MRILVGCEASGTLTSAFRALGHEAYSCDIEPHYGDCPQWHVQVDVFQAIAFGNWDMLVAFPPCTYLTVSGNKWFKDQPERKSGALVGEKRRKARDAAADFFMRLYNSPIPKVAIENPIGCMSSRFRKPDQVLQPYQYGHGETKATCLWLKGLPLLEPTNVVEGREQRLHLLSPSADRQKIRSKTFQGIADAMASQWGGNNEV
ncbi:MAG: hypothetical protein CL678_08615 [Bdellovibrionaceae bacterium]|nr:hypothetical protein [Pseudobdellovibrionaceae bacterium]